MPPSTGLDVLFESWGTQNGALEFQIAGSGVSPLLCGVGDPIAFRSSVVGGHILDMQVNWVTYLSV